MSPATRLLRTAAFAIALASMLSLNASAMRTDYCGAYTDRLCQGQSLDDNEYIESENGDYKFYFHSGGAFLYDATGEELVLVGTLHEPVGFGSPDELTYADPWIQWTMPWEGEVHITIWETVGNEDYLMGYYDEGDLSPDNSHELVLGNDGCLRSIEGSTVHRVWICPS